MGAQYYIGYTVGECIATKVDPNGLLSVQKYKFETYKLGIGVGAQILFDVFNFSMMNIDDFGNIPGYYAGLNTSFQGIIGFGLNYCLAKLDPKNLNDFVTKNYLDFSFKFGVVGTLEVVTLFVLKLTPVDGYEEVKFQLPMK